MKEEYLKYCGIKRIEKKYEGLSNYIPPHINSKYLRLNLNENLFGPSPKCKEALKNISLDNLGLYSLEDNDGLVELLATTFSVEENQIILHNGSSEMIRMIFEMILDRKDTILLPNPGWCYYFSISDVNHFNTVSYPIDELDDTYRLSISTLCSLIERTNPGMIVITTPNMPTGNSIVQEELEYLLKRYKDQFFLIDQAYWGFTDDKINVSEMVQHYQNVIFVRTFSKFYGLANERIGFSICNERLKNIIMLDQPLFRLSYTSRKMAETALQDVEYYDNIRKVYSKERDYFIAEMNKIKGITAFQSDANFVYVKVKNKDVRNIQKKLQEQGYLIRIFNFNNCYCLRVTLYNREVMDFVIQAFQEYV